MMRFISEHTEIELVNAIKAYKQRQYFDECAKLYQLGLLTEEEFQRRCQHIIAF